jgi:hypothetical protein
MLGIVLRGARRKYHQVRVRTNQDAHTISEQCASTIQSGSECSSFNIAFSALNHSNGMRRTVKLRDPVCEQCYRTAIEADEAVLASLTGVKLYSRIGVHVGGKKG